MKNLLNRVFGKKRNFIVFVKYKVENSSGRYISSGTASSLFETENGEYVKLKDVYSDGNYLVYGKKYTEGSSTIKVVDVIVTNIIEMNKRDVKDYYTNIAE